MNQQLALLGAGKIGGILLRAFLEQGHASPESTCATVRHAENARALSQELHLPVSTENARAVQQAGIVMVCVKPQTMREVLEEIRPAVRPGQLLVSVAASVTTDYIERTLGADIPVVRAMPNTPCLVRCGMTAIAPGRFARPDHVESVQKMFECVGRTVVVEEKHMDAVTGLSASGPAFAYVILESLAEAGVKVGLPRDAATLLAAQTLQGAARVVLHTGDHPALLKDAVTTPAGCTIDGLLELEEGKLRVTLIKAVVKATERARELVLEAEDTRSSHARPTVRTKAKTK